MEELKNKITNLEKKKEALIEKIKKINKRLRYKKYEQKALEPFLEKTKDIRVEQFRRQKRVLEFKIATQAYTPRIEREWVKEVKKIDKKLDEVREIERARKKIRYITQDIEDGEKEIKKIEEDLNVFRDDLKKLYSDMKVAKNAERKAALVAKKEERELVSLGDLAMLEETE